jgi:Uncharacterized protein conserved in bacteria (DUF2314)
VNVAELIHEYADWKLALLAIFIFAICPQWILRLLVLVYDRDDPRRKELLGELYAVEYWKRPFWVAEQFETALADGVWPRFVWMLSGRLIYRWTLGNGVRQNQEHPDTFWVPTESEKAAIRPGDDVKLMFLERLPSGWGERMWVTVTKVGRRRLVGRLANDPYSMARLECGDKIRFKRKHVIDIILSEDREDYVAAEGGESKVVLCHDCCAGPHGHGGPGHGHEAQVSPGWVPPA